MITTLAVENYRSLRHLVVPLDRLNVVTGANGTGKSSLYRALRLLADSARGVRSPLSRARAGCRRRCGRARRRRATRSARDCARSRARCAPNR